MTKTDSETRDPFIAALLNEDTLGAVIRAHIHIEQHIYELIELRLIDPEILKEADLEYSQACVLAVALGLDPRLLSPLKFIGNLRNKFAHNLNKELTKQDANNFYKTFSADDKKIINNTYEKLRSTLSTDKDKSLSQRNPRDRFACYASSLRAAILAAVMQAQ